MYSPKIFQFDSVCSVVANHAHIFKDTIRLFLSPDVRLWFVCSCFLSFLSSLPRIFWLFLRLINGLFACYRATGHQSVFYRKISMGYMTQRCWCVLRTQRQNYQLISYWTRYKAHCGNYTVCHKKYSVIQHCTSKTCCHSSKLQTTASHSLPNIPPFYPSLIVPHIPIFSHCVLSLSACLGL